MDAAEESVRALAHFPHPLHPGEEARGFFSHRTAAPRGAPKPAGRQRSRLMVGNIKHGGRSRGSAALGTTAWRAHVDPIVPE